MTLPEKIENDFIKYFGNVKKLIEKVKESFKERLY